MVGNIYLQLLKLGAIHFRYHLKMCQKLHRLQKVLRGICEYKFIRPTNLIMWSRHIEVTFLFSINLFQFLILTLLL